MSIKQAQQSLLDIILDNIPELRDLKIVFRGPSVDPNAQKLYDIWSDESNRLANRRVRLPKNISQSDVRLLEDSGYVQIFGSDLKITPKGASVLNEMILGDDSCALEEKLAGSKKMTKVASKNKKFDTWYARAKNG